MRTWGRNATGGWVQVTAPDYLWLATLAQTLRLSENESPFYANYGIPGHASVMSQLAPNAAVARTQSQYASRFSSLSVTRVVADNPTYKISAVLLNGNAIQDIVS